MSKTPELELPPKFSAEPIAIVGLGAIMPDADNAEEFWQNIITGRDSIQDVPNERWDPELFYDEDRDAPDKSYSKIGAFVKDFKLNPIEYRIPPNVLSQIDMVQQWALASAKEALEDANYDDESFPNEKTAVIVGNSLGGEKSFEVSQRVYFPAIVRAMKKTENFKKLTEKEQDDLIAELEEEYKQNIPVINEDSMPGELANIVAGRIAATFNLRGKNMTSDAACASSLAAIDVAFKGLQAREFDAAVVGGSDRSMDPPTYVKFAKIGALSPDGSFPFDERANGFVMGEGAGMMVLKRLSDAQKAGDKIYALITGVGSSSDGKGKGITAPNPIGQELAVKRALEAANVSAKDIQLIEAHGTSTSVGDYVEISTIEKVFKEQGAQPHSVKIGSIKSQIGHLKSAAGAAGLLKAALAIHHKTYPPSINFETPNPKIDWESSPFEVNTHPVQWPRPPHDVRRAGVSSFGFGGTNFHVIMEEYDPNKTYDLGELYSSVPISETDMGSDLSYREYVARNEDLSLEPVLVGASSIQEMVDKLSTLPEQLPDKTYFDEEGKPSVIEVVNNLTYSPSDDVRVGISGDDLHKLDQLLKIAEGALKDESKREIARNRGIFVSEGMPQGQISFVFPGQGSQYADMMADLAKKYQVVQDTFDEADGILANMLDKPLSTYIFTNGRDRKEVEEGLRQTEITQPAMLTADIALFRLFAQLDISPDMVAGHSLGEYSALVAAGVLSFEDALRAVAIRGKAMSEVDADDKGTMASISGSIEEVEKVLKEVDGYAIAANKNSLSSTVISGSTPGIEEAIEKFKDKGMNAIPLSVSAAFHTTIVEPAAEPLSEYLDEIEFNTPKVPITSNVTGDFFPEDPEEIRNLMKKQVGAAVEWTKQVQTMHNSGATSFFEVGPKRALSSFVSDILSEEDILSVVCNHPKKGDVRTFNDALAAFGALGVEMIRPEPRSEILHPDYRLPKTRSKSVRSREQRPWSSVQEPPAKKADFGELRYDQYQNFVKQVAEFMESDAGIVKKLGFNLDRLVITGTGVGLPGKHKEVFSPDNVDRILRGDNLIEKLPREKLEAQLEKNIRRLIKRSSGEAEFYYPSSYEDVIQLAGQMGKFDLVEEFGVKEEIASTYDIATSLAIASGLEALKDAGIPLVREYKKTSKGTYLPGDYVLPKELQDDTGIVFASAFPGMDSFANEITEFKEHEMREKSREKLTELYGEISRRVSGQAKDYLLNKIDKELEDLDKEIKGYTFNRKILLEVLSFGHAQFAQLIKARGPNTQVNAACASTTQALGIASDWIRTGRAKRVIVISADNITDDLFEWLGSGFLASGAASIKDKVEEAALPFDRRRGGMIVGMGAAGFMVESQSEAKRRGVTPIVELLGTHYSNSAYHGTRLDTRHVSSELQSFMNKVNTVHGIDTDEIGKSLMFMSHETYTPRRGGSAAAEIRSLRETFGGVSSEIHIANTKGFTGHPMGAGIEDAIAIKSVEKGMIPPIANFKEPDPDLGNLKLSSGGKTQVEYALRLAAGFGSQISFALYKRMGSGNRFGTAYEAWLESIGGKKDDLYHHGKTLRLKDTGAPGKISETSVRTPRSAQRQPSRDKSPARSPKPSKPTTPSPMAGADRSEIVDKIQDVMVSMTGYPKEMLDPTLDIEADLGIDTVKMAESIGSLNDQFGIETDKTMNVADYNTINKVADYYVERLGEGGARRPAQTGTSATSASSTTTMTSASSELSGAADVDRSEIISDIQDVMAEMTGYPKDMLDPQLDIEADLGIDTVKMAESIGTLNDQFGVETDQSMNVADYNTIDKVADYYVDRIQSGGSAPSTETSETATVVDKDIQQIDQSAFDKIVSVLVELTGYPEVMIPNQYINFANDLGVDPDTKKELDKKLAEIFALNQSQLEGTETIQDVLNLLSGTSTPAASSKPKKEKKKKSKKTSTPSMMMQQADVSDVVRNKVYNIISSQTGYPEMMVEESLDLLNDLGVDTKTKNEICNEIAGEFNVDVNELTKAQTVHDLLSVLAGGTLPEIEEEDTTEVTQEPQQTAEKIVTDGDTLAEITKIIADKTGYPEEMLDPSLDLESELGIDTVKQAEIFGIAREKYGIPPIEGMQIAEYNTINKISELISSSAGDTSDTSSTSTTAVSMTEDKKEEEAPTFRYVIRENQVEKDGKFDGKVVVIGDPSDVPNKLSNLADQEPTTDFASLDLEKETNLVVLNPDEDTFEYITEFYSFLKKNVDNFGRLVLAVKNLSNDYSIHDLTPLEGSIGGMFKALAMEFSDISAKTVIYHKIGQVVSELANPGVEIVYRNDRRYEIALSSEDLPEVSYTLPDNAILMASGGAQGITYELVKSIANENSTLILLGRTEVRDDAEEIAKLSDKERENRKFDLMKQMQEEGKQVTPVILEKEWSKIAKSATVYESLNELRDMGCEVIYQSVDVTDKDSVKEGFEAIRDKLADRDITHFIHGAGIEISRATKSKKEEEFNLVYSVKANGFENLLAELRLDALQLVVGFSSVAGRFGNATQVDYSAANEYLAKRSAQLNRDGIRSVVIDWSAWDEIGMATRGSTMQVLESQGVTPIPVDTGIARFQAELATGEEPEVVISGKLGALASKVTWYEPDFFRGVMMDEYSGSDLTSHRMLTLSKDRYLDDHRIEGKAVLPGVMGLETMSEVTRAIQNKSAVSLYDVSFDSPVKLPRDEDLEIITKADRSGKALRLNLKSKFIGPDGKQLGDLRQHFSATIYAGERVPGFPLLKKKELKKLRKTELLDQKSIYELFFHGPSYQVIGGLNQLYDDAVVATFNKPEKPMFEEDADLEIQPLVLEAAFQTAGLHLLYVKKKMGLPAKVDAINLFGTGKPVALIRAYYVTSTDTHSTYNVEMIDEEGNCVALMLNYQMIHTGDVETEDLKLADQTDLITIRQMMGQLNTDLVAVDTECLEEVSEEFIEGFLTISERTRFSGIQAKKKRTEWLAGRIAAKLALGKYRKVSPGSIEIEKDENRSPFAVISGEKSDVSITHSNGVALAIAGEMTVDLEKIESRAPSFIKEAFSEEEIKKYDLLNMDDTTITKFWTMKEAHLKRMRIGLKTNLHGVKINENGSLKAKVESPQGSSICKSSVNDTFILTVAEEEDD